MKLRITNINKFVCLDNRYKIFDEMKIHGESDESFFITQITQTKFCIA